MGGKRETDLVERLSGAVLHLLTATPPYVVVRNTRHLGRENSMKAGSLERVKILIASWKEWEILIAS